jgi:hypothetical protein
VEPQQFEQYLQLERNNYRLVKEAESRISRAHNYYQTDFDSLNKIIDSIILESRKTLPDSLRK